MLAILRMRAFVALTFALVATLLVGMVGVAAPADAASARQKQIWRGLDVAKAQKGDPYRYGASGPGAFDCSGLTYYAFRKAGVRNIPRTSSAQARFTKRIPRKNMRKGDLMFFHSGGRVYHVGIFAGWKDGRRLILHAPSSGKRVHTTKVWTSSWFAGTLRFR